jgi:tetratricopeptide (TPR) repeat protein
MTQQHWQRVEELFHAALELPQAERRSFLDNACGGDSELLAEVESLLGSDPRRDPATLESSPIAQAVRQAAVLMAFPPRQGDRVGHYRIVEEIGRGGMGLVYRATRADQEFQMQVAIKVAKTGMDTGTVLARFRRERQILANLDHRYVAKLLDGGTTEDGLPYFVMEYVEGQPIHKYAQAKNLSIRDRLILFRGVLEAVAHAHQNLVVHLDLKPSNILIAADGTPKLLDFGISRLLDPTLPGEPTPEPGSGSGGASPTGNTAFGRLLTPDYASPEQIRGETVTTATDVYSLGAVLYQLLTGELPHELEGLSPRQTERVICSLDVMPPSERVPALRRELAGDLDHIVLKAMAKDSARRYRSAQELDDELRRYLEGLPVRAVAATAFYRLGKFLWRNRLAAVAAAAIFVGLLAGLLTLRWEARLAEAQRHVAESESNRAEMNAAQAQGNAAEAQKNAAEARANARRAEDEAARAEAALRNAESAQREAVAQKKLADQSLEEVRQLSEGYLFDFNDALSSSPGTLAVRQRMVNRGISSLGKLIAQAESKTKLSGELASAYMLLGDLLGNPDMANLGDTKSALENYRKALPMVEDLQRKATGPDQMVRDNYLLTQAELHGRIGEVLFAVGPVHDSLAEYGLAARMARDLLPRHEGDLRFDRAIAVVLVGNSHAQIAQGEGEAAKASTIANYPVLIRLMARHPDDPSFGMWLAADYATDARCMLRDGDLKAGRATYQKEVELLEELEQKPPKDPSRTRMLMFAYSHLGDTLGNPHMANLGDFNGAVAAYEKTSRLAEEAAAADPQNVLTQLDAAMSASRLGGLSLAQGNPTAALPPLQKAIAGLERIVARDPNNHGYVNNLAPVVELVAEAQEALGQFADAEASYAKEIELILPMMRLDPANTTASATLTESHFKWGMVLSREANPKAFDHIDLAIAEAARVLKLHPNEPRVTLRQARCFGGRALAGYRLATRPGASSEARAQGLRQAREDVEHAEQIVAGVPPENRGAINAWDMSVIADARRLLGEAH